MRVVAPVGAEGVSRAREEEAGGPTPVQSPLTLHATLLSPSAALSHVLRTARAYVHVVQTSGYNTGAAAGATVRLAAAGGQEDVVLREGDGVYVTVGGTTPGGAENELKVENVGDRVAEVLVFDLD